MDAAVTRWKQEAAEYAVQYVESGMVVGLGHGTTAHFAILRLAELLNAGALHDVRGVPCSRVVETEARRLGIPLTTLDETPMMDLTIDGADEVTPGLDAIKGRGGALLREKIVAQATRREILIVDEGKCSPTLGLRAAVPVEVIPFGWRTQAAFLESLGARWTLRREDGAAPFRTDEGNYLLDAEFGPLTDPAALAARLQARVGIVAHGLFLRLVAAVVIAGPHGIRVTVREEAA